MSWAEQIHRAIADSRLGLYRVAKDAGVGYATVWGFMHGERGLSVDTAEKIGRVVGVELRVVRKGQESRK